MKASWRLERDEPVVKVAERPGTTGNEGPHVSESGMRRVRGARSVRVFMGVVNPQTPCGLLAPFQGAPLVR